MSAPPPDHPDRAPQSSAVRLVPYSPPRASTSSEESSASARQAATHQTSESSTGDDGRTNPRTGKATSSGNGQQNQGSTGALPASSAAPLSLAKPQGAGVSDRGPATIRRISSTDARSANPATEIPVSSSPNLNFNAPSRGRLSAASHRTNVSQASRQSASSQFGDVESVSSSPGPSEPPSGQRRPQSRRRNFVAVLNEDKTFSLVPKRQRDPEPQPQNPPRSSSALSEYSGPGGRSSQLPSFPSTPRVSQASSHEGYSSYASSHYDRPSSSLAETIPDRSITPNTPVPSSPGSSTQETITEDLVPESSTSSALQWHNRMLGGLRRVANLPSGKQPAHSPEPGSDTTETPQPAVPETAPSHDENLVDTRATQEEQASVHSSSPSDGSDTANYRVFSAESEAPSFFYHPEAQTSTHEEEEAARGSDESLVDSHLRPQSSFATVQTTSTDFETTNYKIYTHSDDEGSDEDHSNSPVAGPSSPAKRTVPQIQPQTSTGSFQSGASSASDNANYKTYGSPSPVLSPVPEASPIPEEHEYTPAQSFLSPDTTTYDTTNYRVYGGSISPSGFGSVESFNPPSPSGSYTPLIRSPTGAVPSLYTQEEEAGPSGTANEPNFVTHGDPSPLPSRQPSRDATPNTIESDGTVVRHPREEDSQDSLAVAPLRPRRESEESIGYYRARSRSRSREDLHTQKSKKSLKTRNSSTSTINEEAAENFYTGQAYLDAQAEDYEDPSSSVPGPSERQRQLDEQRERERQQREAPTWEGAEAASGSQGGPMALPVTPHQWSSQLSTVLSESEPESSSSGNRGSLVSHSPQGSYGSHERRSSRGWSSHSRQMLSISSSLAAELEAASRSRSNSNSQHSFLERPSPAYRGFQGAVRDHDEDGDGLAELHQISPRPSRSRLSDMFQHSNASDRNLHSSASSRSFNNGIPLWAKLYYGSGERPHLRSTSISSMSDLSSRPGSAIRHGGSPLSEQFSYGLRSPRRRPREIAPEEASERQYTRGSMEIQPIQAEDDQYEPGFRRSIRRMTSSLWSPHLRRDVRARNRYSIWDTPSVAWSAESGMFGRRNVQVVLFVVGFIFPFSWMIGALLPLPKPSPLAMVQRDSSYSDLGVRTNSHEYERHIESVDELRYENARWWRMLNRVMSVVGLLIIATVVVLLVLALKQGWGTRG